MLSADSSQTRVQIVPVIDLAHGQVVRGVAGRRSEYLPIEGRIANDARPASVARGFAQRFGFQQAYVADLDAICGAEPNWNALDEIAEAGLDLLLDAGVGCTEAACKVLERTCRRQTLAAVVVGLESVRSDDGLRGVCEAIGPEKAVFSLDLKCGRPLTGVSRWQERSAADIAGMAADAGFRRLIVLDLASVGVGQGPSVTFLCEQIHVSHPGIELISGGGVRNMADVMGLARAGCRAVLVASALHDGRITPEQVMSLHGGSRAMTES